MGLPGRGGCVSSAHPEPRAGPGRPLLPPRTDFLLGLSPVHLRTGRKASILIQLLLFAAIGLATAFVPSFELYMVMRFTVATAVAGYFLTSVSLREYLALKPSAPDCLRGLGRYPHLQWSHLCFLGWD